MKKRRSPQEKKRLSYSKDRRNTYGWNDKTSHKNIARNKRNRHRSERHREQQQRSAALGPADEVLEPVSMSASRVLRAPAGGASSPTPISAGY